MTELNAQPENPQEQGRYDPELLKKGLRCDLDQYEMLKRCSDSKDMSEWNGWRKRNPNEDVLLEGGCFTDRYLKGVLLNSGDFTDEKGKKHNFTAEVHLEKSNLSDCQVQEANLVKASLRGSMLVGTHLEHSDLKVAHLEDTFIWEAHLEHANLVAAHLENAKLWETHLQGAQLLGAHLEHAMVYWCDVDGSTSVWGCWINRYTHFGGTSLNGVHIHPSTKQLLEYNIRRKNWEDWYKEHPTLEWVVKPFWLMSDYGLSTGRIVAVFLGLAFGFATIYWLWGLAAPTGIVDYLFVDANGAKVGYGLALLRALHFSVVIMTVGFTNMHANAHSFWAHILVGLQMILGFVLLGALVTRFAVLFTACGPAGRFADDKKKAADDRGQKTELISNKE